MSAILHNVTGTILNFYDTSSLMLVKHYGLNTFVLRDPDAQPFRILPSEGCAKVIWHIDSPVFETIDGIPAYHQLFNGLRGLPPYRAGHLYVVSAEVRYQYQTRSDLLTAQGPVYDRAFRCVGYTSLAR